MLFFSKLSAIIKCHGQFWGLVYVFILESLWFSYSWYSSFLSSSEQKDKEMQRVEREKERSVFYSHFNPEWLQQGNYLSCTLIFQFKMRLAISISYLNSQRWWDEVRSTFQKYLYNETTAHRKWTFLHFLQARGCFSCTTLDTRFLLRKISSKGEKTGHYLAIY